MVTYDIKDVFINIPIEGTLTITKALLLKNNNKQMAQQIITLLRLVLSQYCFTFRNQIYEPEKGIAVGSPISGTIAEIFLQHLGDIHIKQLIDSKKHNILHMICR